MKAGLFALVALLCALAPGQALARPRDDAMAGAFRCNAQPDERQWLDCYYAAAQLVRVHLGLSPAPQARTAYAAPALPAAPPPAAPQPAAEQFGLRKPAPGNNVERVVSRMASYRFDRYGIFTATLANGQVWRQLSGDTAYARWSKPAESYVVSISHGLLGSYRFQVKDSPGMFKVRREQ